MRIAIDVREACRQKKTGKGQWTAGLVLELMKRQCSLVLYTDAPVPAAWQHEHVQVIQFDLSGLTWHREVATHLLEEKLSDVYISTTSYLVPFFLGTSFPVIPIVHDLIAFRREPHDWKATLIERLTLGRTVRSAAHVCTVSDSTKNDLLKKYPQLPAQNITPVYAGPFRTSAPLSTDDHRTILCVGTLSPRKNQKRLVEAYAKLPAALREQYRLLIVGARGWHDEDIVAQIQETPGVEWKGYVSDEEYEALLSSCSVFALPSLYEGFGLQILDAMQRGIPVLTSTGGSLAEVAGNAAVTVDAENMSSITNGLTNILTDDALRSSLRTAGPAQAASYSWKRTADLLLEVIDQISSVA